MTKQKTVALFSGGMDSLIMWEYVGRPPTLYVDLGHHYAEVEKHRVSQLIPDTEIISLKSIGMFEKPDAEIPLRNLYLAMVAANLGYDQIWLCVQRHEMSIPDRTPEFFVEASAMLSKLTGRQIVIGSPFVHMDKVDMVRWYVEVGLPVQRLTDTWACYTPVMTEGEGFYEPDHCGNCPACFRRFVAMRLNGIHEDWHHRVFGSRIADEYLRRALGGDLPDARAEQTVKALQP